MSALPTLLERNARYADAGVPPQAIAPRFPTLVVSCLDARADPAHFLGLTPGDALVVRNVGGRVTPEVTRQIGLLVTLAGKQGLPPPELVLVHHSDCGMERLAAPPVRAAVAQASGVPEDELAALAIADHDASLADDVARLRESPHVPAGLTVRGVRLDHTTGRAELRVDEVL